MPRCVCPDTSDLLARGLHGGTSKQPARVISQPASRTWAGRPPTFHSSFLRGSAFGLSVIWVFILYSVLWQAFGFRQTHSASTLSISEREAAERQTSPSPFRLPSCVHRANALDRHLDRHHSHPGASCTASSTCHLTNARAPQIGLLCNLPASPHLALLFETRPDRLSVCPYLLATELSPTSANSQRFLFGAP